MKKLILLAAVCLFSGVACSAEATRSTQQQAKAPDNKQVSTEKLKAQAQELNDAMISGNYDRAIDLMYPKLVELAGGKQNLRAFLESQMKEMTILSIKVGEPHDLFEVNGESYAIVPTTMSMKVPEGALVGDGCMVGYSKDKGEHWTFVDATGKSGASLKPLFPNAGDKLRIPETKPPVLQKSPEPQ
jgi:hypothetical protein